MINKTLIYTALFGALFMTSSLKVLHFFNFINWSPIGWSKKWGIFTSEHVMHVIVNWVLLILALTLLFVVVYYIVSFLYQVPPSITSIILTIVFVLGVEWFIEKPDSSKEIIGSLSLSFLGITAIVFRFIIGTAVFMKEKSIENSK